MHTYIYIYIYIYMQVSKNEFKRAGKVTWDAQGNLVEMPWEDDIDDRKNG
jgi:YD repeat-containing protein